MATLKLNRKVKVYLTFLYYSLPEGLITTNLKPSEKVMADNAFVLHMDDSVYSVVGFGLQKESEFLKLFNYKILKAIEGGVYKRLYRRHHMDLFTKEKFEMIEAQPLALNNVMFCFIILGIGICLSVFQIFMELITKKIFKNHKSNESRDTVR